MVSDQSGTPANFSSHRSGHDCQTHHPLADQLVSWLTRNGGYLSPDVQIVYSEAHGFHMRARTPLTSPVVVSCPLRLTLSHLNLDPNQKEVVHLDSLLQQCQGRIPDHILAYLLLIEQRSKGEASLWHPYFACLPEPETMTTPIWFDEDDMAFLMGTGLAPAARERKEEIHKQWQRAVAVLKDLDSPLADTLDLISLTWAATIFTSRAFISTHILPGRETVPVLFPVVDILNHSVDAKVEWDFQPYHSFALKCLEGDSIQPGQELFNNYAPKQNDELLLGYGFCLENNPIEQFALKLAFPPMLHEYAREMGLLSMKNVPFGMSPAFLEKDPYQEQHFLRAKGHPFGRYENHVPIFRGIPPYIVHIFFIQTIMILDRDVHTLDTGRPGIRITLQVLLLLHQAIEQRCQSLPLHCSQQPRDDKQKYAKIYRDGQAKILHAVRQELAVAIDKLRVVDGQVPPSKPALLSIIDGLSALTKDFPAEAQTFRRGLMNHNLQSSEDATVIWTLLLIVCVSLMSTSSAPDDGLIYAWLRDLFIRCPLPTLEQGIEDAETYTFVDENFGDFFHPHDIPSHVSPIEYLDDLGLTFTNRATNSIIHAFITGYAENFGVRVIMWAMHVVEQELLPVMEEGVVTKCLFVHPLGASGVRSKVDWIFEDTEALL